MWTELPRSLQLRVKSIRIAQAAVSQSLSVKSNQAQVDCVYIEPSLAHALWMSEGTSEIAGKRIHDKSYKCSHNEAQRRSVKDAQQNLGLSSHSGPHNDRSLT